MCSCVYVCTEVFALLIAWLEPKRSYRSATAYFTRIARERGEMPVDQQKAIKVCSSMKPITIVERVVVVSNGVSSRPSTLSIHSMCGKDMLTIIRCNKDWCRLLRNQGAWCRPLAGLGLWKVWTDAVEEARREHIAESRKSKAIDPCDEFEALECTSYMEKDNGNDKPLSRHFKAKAAHATRVITISLPEVPGSEKIHKMTVQNSGKIFAFEYTKKNLQWLCAYTAKDTLADKFMVEG